MEQSDQHPGLAEDWAVLESFLPPKWRDLAVTTGALKGLRKDKSAENLLRVLLLHLGCGHSLQETVARARQAQLAELTAAALWNRLQKSADWLRGLCVALFRERGLERAGAGGIQVRALDATTVKETGRGSQWRIHHSVRLPSLLCDYFGLTAAEGAGTGKSFQRFPINAGDYLLAGEGYSSTAGLCHVAGIDAFATVRVNAESLEFGTLDGGSFDLMAAVNGLRAREVGCWPAAVLDRGGEAVAGRVCAVRKSAEAIRLARRGLVRQAPQRDDHMQSRRLELARYVILFTTYPGKEFPAEDVMEWYRTYWRVELVFKRFKSLAQLGHVPDQADESAKAWLYGKLLVALLIEKLVDHARYISPWGCDIEETPA